MESGKTKERITEKNLVSFEEFNKNSNLTQQRLEFLIQANAKTAFEKSLFLSQKEKSDYVLLKNPLNQQTAFAYFGLLLGTFPPAAMFIRFLIDARIFGSEEFWILGFIFIVNLITAIVGYFSGKFIGKIVSELEKISWHRMILTLPFVGAFWGMLAGGAGGLIIFIIGAFFGALLGATVGGLALPVFTIFHRLLKCGDKIEGKYFLPLAFGITFVISAFFLGL